MKFPPSMQVLERGWLSSNNILFIGAECTAIVDTGYKSHAEQTLQLVQHALGDRKLDAIYNTHLHSDHCGGNKILQDHYQPRTFVPAAEMIKVQRWERTELSFQATGQQCDQFSADEVIKPGDLLRLGELDWQALAAPGHDPHSVVLYCEKEGILISADALWEKGFGVIFPELDGRAGFAETRATLDMIAELDVRVVIPGHGKPFKDCKKALDVAHSRIDYLEADPTRNAQNAIKVLLKFLLLERQKIKLTEVPKLLTGIPLVSAANTHYLSYGTIHLAHWAVTQLKRAGACDVQGDFLVDVA
ncbi:MAG: MBL fold metallo-hydrolase [Burkholderiaceae bacterium]|jgi:glyoxylase-like metal-dependent hydrolase (beta-lactamase superfamily II)